MSTTGLEEALARLHPVELGQVDAAAALLTRRDRKYIVPASDAERLIDLLAPASRVLAIDGRRMFRYESVYFDTPELDSYLAAARDRPRRWKVRTRSYVDSGRCVLEIKRRDPRGRTVKERREHPAAQRERVDDVALAFVSACPVVAPVADRLRHVLRTRYRRATLLLADGTRITVDVDVRSTAADGRAVTLEQMAVVETKSPGAPSDADRALWVIGHRPIRLSKFCTSLAAINRTLPSNKWTRALGLPWRT